MKTLALALVAATVAPALLAQSLTITPISWGVIGLDSNNVNAGPNQFMVGARVCYFGPDATPSGTVTTTFTWIADAANPDTTNYPLGNPPGGPYVAPYINLADNMVLNIPSLNPGQCQDFYYNGLVSRTTSAYNTWRRYEITASSPGLTSVNLPGDNYLYVEKLVSQNRNTVGSISGPTEVVVGGIYTYKVSWATTTNGYEELEHFVTYLNGKFRLLQTYSTYSTGGSNTTIWADGCTWVYDTTSPIGDSPGACSTSGKNGGNVETWFTVLILEPGTTTLATAIYDFSGNSYHYNSDYGLPVNTLTFNATASADLSITMTESKDPVTYPDSYSYGGTISNSGPSSVPTGSNPVVTFTIPPNTTFSSITFSRSGSPVTGEWSCSASGTTVTCTALVPLDGNTANTTFDPYSLDYTLNVSVASPLQNGSAMPGTATIQSDVFDPNPSNNTVMTSTTFATSGTADLQTSSSSPATYTTGSGDLTFTHVVTNNGPSTSAAGATVKLSIPAGSTFVSASGAGVACGAPSAGFVTCTTTVAMAPGNIQPISLVVTPTVTSGSLTSSATVTPVTVDSNPANNTSNTTTVILASNTQIDLSIGVTAAPNPVAVTAPSGTSPGMGESILFTNTVRNNGPSAITANGTTTTVTVTLRIPQYTIFSNVTVPLKWTCNAPPAGTGSNTAFSTFTCSLKSGQTLALNEIVRFPLTVSASPSTPTGNPAGIDVIQYQSSVAIGGTAPALTDGYAPNNLATAAVSAASNSEADIAVTKTASASTINQGQQLVYTITATNNGPAAATSVTIRDSVPSGVTINSVSATRTGCPTGPGWTSPIDCTFAPLAVGQSAVITVVVTPSTTGLITNTAFRFASSPTDPIPGNDSAFADTFVIGPTAAAMAVAEAVRTADGIDILWRTDYEADNVGFNLYRDFGGTRSKVTPSMVGGSVLISGPTPLTSGFSYRRIDRTPVPGAVYWIESVDLSGRSEWTGPIVPREANSESLAIVARTPETPTFEETNARATSEPGHVTRLESMSFARTSAPEAMPADVILAKQFDIAGEPGSRLQVAREGWYRVSRASIASSGFDPGENPWAIEMTVDGLPIPIAVNDGGDGRWDPADTLEFYAVGLDTPYSGSRTYWVRNGNNGERFAPKSKNKATASTRTSFQSTVSREDRYLYLPSFASNDDRHSFWGAVVTAAPATLPMTVSNIAPTGTARISLSVLGVTWSSHAIRIDVNGFPVGTLAFSGQTVAGTELELPPGYLREGANYVGLTAMAPGGDVSVVDVVRITYPHLYVADQDTLHFAVEGARETIVRGFSSPDIRVLDVTKPTQPQEIESKIVADGRTWSLIVSPHDKGTRTLYASTASRALTPASITANQPSDWWSQHNRADFLIITYPEFADAVKPLADARSAEGLETRIVRIDDVFDEFGFGSRSPDAIRAFLAHTQHRWKKAPRWVLLVGDASCDPRNFFGLGDLDLVPTREVPGTFMKAASDDWLVDFDDDGLPNLYIGRLSVATTHEATVVVQKILSYQLSPQPVAQFIADIDDNGFSFEALANSSAALVPAPWEARVLAAGRVAGARSAVLSALRSGPAIVNYFGHASVETIGRRMLFQSSDVPTLLNASNLSFYVMMDCLNGLFFDPYSTSLSERLLRARSGGAVAVWTSSGMTLPDAQAEMNRALWESLAANPMATLGELTATAKAGTRDQDVRRSWILLGDPTMRLSN